MYLVELVWVAYSKDGSISDKNATISVFRTKEEAWNKLDELFHFFYLKGDDYLRTLENFKIVSKCSVGATIYRGRITQFNID